MIKTEIQKNIKRQSLNKGGNRATSSQDIAINSFISPLRSLYL